MRLYKDVVIIGAGAAGLMGAIEAGKRGRSVLVIEHAEAIGKKILISGGGRCNFTNMYTTPENFISENPHFCKSALARYTPADFIALVENHNIPYYEKKLGQLFCTDSSRRITAMLESECQKAGVEIALSTEVLSVEKNSSWIVHTSRGNWACESLIVACGGLSIPKIGATDFGLRLARQFGVHVIPPHPALVPLTWNENDRVRFSELAGVSADAVVSCGVQSFRENVLFTHRGLSGPAILQISSYWKEGDTITIDFLPDLKLSKLFEEQRRSKTDWTNLLAQYLPKRLVQTWGIFCPAPKPMTQLSNAELQNIADSFHEWKWIPAGTEGFEKAEVTAGGVDTDELSSKTMECKKISGLYFIGEVVDVTGHLGGFNFQWAWASGFVAGQSA